MTSSWFIKLAFKCLLHIAWCASIQAIETDCYAETKNLISYWILLSFIYLFDYALFNLLPWFHLWQYINLMIVFWLVTPDFGRASYVCNNLIRSTKPQMVTCWRKCFVERDNFLMHAEEYVKENGTEALEKLITSKSSLIRELDLVQTNGERVQIEHKDIKDLEAIEKTEIHRTYANIVATQKSSSAAIVETKGTAESEGAGGEVVQSSNSTEKQVQRECTCALCLVKVTCEKTLNSHLKGKKHRAACEEALKLKMPPGLQKKLTEPIRIVNSKIICKACNVMLPSEDCVDIFAIPEIVPSQNASAATVETKGSAESNKASGEATQSSTFTQKEMQKEWNCALCLVTTSNEMTWNSHLSGRKHRAAIKTFIAKKQPTLQKQNYAESTHVIKAGNSKETPKTNGKGLQHEHIEIKDLDAIAKKEIPATKQRTCANIAAASQKASSAIIETKGTLGRATAGGEVSQSSTSTQKEVQKEWACALCLVTTSSETTLNSHLSGRKHMNTIEALKAKKQPTLEKNLCEPFRMVNSKIICKVCNIMLPSEEYMASHIKGWKHLAKIQT
ncbi:hypothetical protein RYX36_035179 [Vicia faba]